MNKLLVATFADEPAADAGLQALRRLHADGAITLYASGVLARDAAGAARVSRPLDTGHAGAATGLGVASLIGLLGGPSAGAPATTVVGAIRDFWAAGVGLDFVEQAQRRLRPGRVALVTEVDEEWVVPVDIALEAAGGEVLRGTRTEVVEAQLDHDIAAFKAEIKELESEAFHAGGAARTRLHDKLACAKASLDGAVQRAQQRLDALRAEADGKAAALRAQLAQGRVDVRARIDDRVKRMKTAYQARSARLAQAGRLTREAQPA